MKVNKSKINTIFFFVLFIVSIEAVVFSILCHFIKLREKRRGAIHQ